MVQRPIWLAQTIPIPRLPMTTDDSRSVKNIGPAEDVRYSHKITLFVRMSVSFSLYLHIKIRNKSK